MHEMRRSHSDAFFRFEHALSENAPYPAPDRLRPATYLADAELRKNVRYEPPGERDLPDNLLQPLGLLEESGGIGQDNEGPWD